MRDGWTDGIEMRKWVVATRDKQGGCTSIPVCNYGEEDQVKVGGVVHLACLSNFHLPQAVSAIRERG